MEPGLPQVTVLLGHWMTQDLLKQWTLERVRLCGCVCVMCKGIKIKKQVTVATFACERKLCASMLIGYRV